jgi:hypothetical protein
MNQGYFRQLFQHRMTALFTLHIFVLEYDVHNISSEDKYTYNHYHKHQGLGHSACSVSRVTAALASVSLVSQLFSFLVDCIGMILEGFVLWHSLQV